MIKELLEFCNTDFNSPKSKWFIHKDMKVYVRNTQKAIYAESRVCRTITIAAIEVNTPRQKLGTSFVNILHTFHNKECTYIESVHTPYFREWLTNNGYLLNYSQGKGGLSSDFYKYK